MSYNKLFFNKLEVKVKNQKIKIDANFLCPKCGDQKKPTNRDVMNEYTVKMREAF